MAYNEILKFEYLQKFRLISNFLASIDLTFLSAK